MKFLPARVVLAGFFTLSAFSAPAQTPAAGQAGQPAGIDRAQVPGWSDEDLRFFLHGSISTEVVPDTLFAAFQETYPKLFPKSAFQQLGALAESGEALPVGFSRRQVSHLGGLTAIGINCAACHLAEVRPSGGGPAVRILGVSSQFDVEAFFGAVVAATFQTGDPANLAQLLPAYLAACDPGAAAAVREALERSLRQQSHAMAELVAAHVAEEGRMGGGEMFQLEPDALRLDAQRARDVAEVMRTAREILRLLHNMRTALHVPHVPPRAAPPASGPGRNNAFGILSLALFGEPTIYGPAKFGVAWNLADRRWVHWDGNTRSPLVRNLAASLGLGAPLVGKRGLVDFAAVERQTKLSEQIRAPKFPWKIDAARAERGRAHFEKLCAACHAQADESRRLCGLDETGTDPNRARIFTPHQAELYNRFFSEVEIPGYRAEAEPVRSTGRYVAADLAGVWARSPYLHNGSVRTMADLLRPAAERARQFHRGSQTLDLADLGYTDEGSYLLDTTTDGNSNAGHEYGTQLPADQKRDLIEFLKSL